jgi:membrane-bound inhibitor of C-type lysozyme
MMSQKKIGVTFPLNPVYLHIESVYLCDKPPLKIQLRNLQPMLKVTLVKDSENKLLFIKNGETSSKQAKQF